MTTTAVGAADDDDRDVPKALIEHAAAVDRLAASYRRLAFANIDPRRLLSAAQPAEFEAAMERVRTGRPLSPAHLKALDRHPVLTVVGPGDVNWVAQVGIARDVILAAGVPDTVAIFGFLADAQVSRDRRNGLDVRRKNSES